MNIILASQCNLQDASAWEKLGQIHLSAEKQVRATNFWNSRLLILVRFILYQPRVITTIYEPGYN
jgi:hypothetical protein